MKLDLLVLNYNGAALLRQCLPSVLRAAQASRHECRVAVVDNDSRDESCAILAAEFPGVKVHRRPNRGLASFNDVLSKRAGQIAVLLNNDIQLAENCLDNLVAPFEPSESDHERCFVAAPLCWQFDGCTYDGQKTAVQWRYGLVQATWQFPGYQHGVHRSGWTASAGAALAVDRAKFLALGGFDPLFFPGRLEDLDFAYRGYLAGYHACYVPDAVAYHQGAATFDRVFSRQECDLLTLRNTLLFQWKNLRHPWHLALQFGGGGLRLLRDFALWPWQARNDRFTFLRAWIAARQRWREAGPRARQRRFATAGEREFFRRFHPAELAKF